MVIQDRVRMTPGYTPDVTKQVAAMRAMRLVQVKRRIKPREEQKRQHRRIGPLLLRRSERKHTHRRVTVAKAYGIMVKSCV
jgi:hypothetical protein